MDEIRSVQRHRDPALENKKTKQTCFLGQVLFNLEWFSDPVHTPTPSYTNVTD